MDPIELVVNKSVFEKIKDGMLDLAAKLLVDEEKRKYNWNLLFTLLGLNDGKFRKVVYHDFKYEKYYNNYIFLISPAITVKDFENKIENISYFLNVPVEDLKLNQVANKLNLRVRNNEPMNFEYEPQTHKAKGYKIPIGINLDTLKIRYWDLSDGANANCYIAGSTRCGKSNLLRLIMTVLTQKSIADIQFSLINPKIVDLVEFQNVKNTKHYTENPTEATEILLENIEEMKRRYVLFAKHKGVKNIWDYREKVNKMPVRLIVVEEMSTFEGNKEFHDALKLLAQQSAGAGILLLLTTQLPNKDTLSNQVKNNINSVIGGKCKDSIRSDIIVEDGELHKLRGRGHMKVFDSDSYGTEIQSFYISDTVVEEITSNNIKQNKRVASAGTLTTHGDNKNFG